MSSEPLRKQTPLQHQHRIAMIPGRTDLLSNCDGMINRCFGNGIHSSIRDAGCDPNTRIPIHHSLLHGYPEQYKPSQQRANRPEAGGRLGAVNGLQ